MSVALSSSSLSLGHLLFCIHRSTGGEYPLNVWPESKLCLYKVETKQSFEISKGDEDVAKYQEGSCYSPYFMRKNHRIPSHSCVHIRKRSFDTSGHTEPVVLVTNHSNVSNPSTQVFAQYSMMKIYIVISPLVSCPILFHDWQTITRTLDVVVDISCCNLMNVQVCRNSIVLQFEI